MTQQERELVWLTQKIKKDEELIELLEDYMDANHYRWSKGVTMCFLDMILKKKDQLYYEQHRQEKLAWRIHDERENREGRITALPPGM